MDVPSCPHEMNTRYLHVLVFNHTVRWFSHWSLADFSSVKRGGLFWENTLDGAQQTYMLKKRKTDRLKELRLERNQMKLDKCASWGNCESDRALLLMACVFLLDQKCIAANGMKRDGWRSMGLGLFHVCVWLSWGVILDFDFKTPCIAFGGKWQKN